MLTNSPGSETEPTGTPHTRLIILRGNSGSGKSTIAHAVRDRYGHGCALVEQDYLRRTVLRERDIPQGNAAALIEHTIRFALDIGYNVICEGILHSTRYSPMLHRLCAAHRGTTTLFYLDVSLTETLRRHASRPQASEFTTQDMRRWYLPHDHLGFPTEHVIREGTSLTDTVNLIAAHLPPTASTTGGPPADSPFFRAAPMILPTDSGPWSKDASG